ncbi:MAG: polyhydroxyalkanoate depolymerase, partial [Colwellia sp.]|nr:polyhydroxyalkanoate depolymerase [Colwellia sp.]
MKYALFDMMYQQTKPIVAVLKTLNTLVTSEINPLAKTTLGSFNSAILQTSARLLDHYPKQEWQFEDVTVEGKKYKVEINTIKQKPFANLLKFSNKGLKSDAPKVLFVPALSGHHATLTANTFVEFFPDHQVYACDWLDAKNVPVSDGRFGLEEYIDYVIDFLKELGENVHVVGVCQAGPAVLVASAVLSEEKASYKPASLTLIAAPMDMRVNPGRVSEKMKSFDMDTFKKMVVHTVPNNYLGKGRKVYPGSIQLANFIAPNIKNHIQAHFKFAEDVFFDHDESAEKHRKFYDEYFAILDMTEEFILETLTNVFLDHTIAKNIFVYKGKTVDFKSIIDIPLLAMEGKEDDMIRLGQCTAAVDFCSELPDNLKEKYVQEGVGHYGIFNGSIFRKEVAPKIKQLIQSANQLESKPQIKKEVAPQRVKAKAVANNPVTPKVTGQV